MSLLAPLRRGCLVLLAVMTLALAATGHSHRAPSVQDERLVSYILAGGALADICGTMEGMGAAGERCPLCRVQDAWLPPDPLCAIHPAGFAQALSSLPAVAAHRPGFQLDPSRMTRAPPSV